MFAILIAADLLAKHFAQSIFKNNNFAFSLPLPVWFMFVVYFSVMAAMVFYCFKNYEKFTLGQSLAWVFIFAGAFANIIERIILGYVRDFVYITVFNWTGIYNLADFYIILGILILLFYPKSKTHDS